MMESMENNNIIYIYVQILHNYNIQNNKNVTKCSLQRRVAMIVDEMGKASARAQDLKMPITTAEKLSKSDHTIYLFSEQTNEEYVYIYP